jgi:hypothetical protein
MAPVHIYQLSDETPTPFDTPGSSSWTVSPPTTNTTPEVSQEPTQPPPEPGSPNESRPSAHKP